MLMRHPGPFSAAVMLTAALMTGCTYHGGAVRGSAIAACCAPEAAAAARRSCHDGMEEECCLGYKQRPCSCRVRRTLSYDVACSQPMSLVSPCAQMTAITWHFLFTKEAFFRVDQGGFLSPHIKGCSCLAARMALHCSLLCRHDNPFRSFSSIDSLQFHPKLESPIEREGEVLRLFQPPQG